MRIILLLAVSLWAFSCKDQNEPLPADIDAELAPYVNLFYSEAESRGFTLDQNIDASIVDELSACGQGHSPDFNGMFDRPTILIKESCWAALDATAREVLVFHELGHAVLNRIHIDEVLPNGFSKSLMCAGADFSCSDLPDYSFCPEHRDYYCDELFNASTAPPQWATRTWNATGTMLADLNTPAFFDWQTFTNCSANSFQVAIDSVSQNRPANYSLKLFSSCGDFLSVRKRIAINNPAGVEALQLRCNLYHDLRGVGDGLQLSLFVKDEDGTFTSFNRSVPRAIIDQDNNINNFSLQAECLEPTADSLIITFLYTEGIEGELLIGDLDILWME